MPRAIPTSDASQVCLSASLIWAHAASSAPPGAHGSGERRPVSVVEEHVVMSWEVQRGWCEVRSRSNVSSWLMNGTVKILHSLPSVLPAMFNKNSKCKMSMM